MPRNPKIKRVSNVGLYKKLDSIEKKIKRGKNRSMRIFAISILFSFGLVVFSIGISLLYQLTTELGADLWVTCIAYMVTGGILLIIGSSMFLKISKK